MNPIQEAWRKATVAERKEFVRDLCRDYLSLVDYFLYCARKEKADGTKEGIKRGTDSDEK
ncbi:MAG: hypothetical protein K8I29_19450 [Alphaproteobacteria bacterium]|uniref:Uncharacterized protein n=1 Tax=Candidatus Nitrobium versatile TaxID=2884831 RepID=A0A953M3M7_9BACT|nr:hypothetical protein [Candidatus Nitrobium versatile]